MNVNVKDSLQEKGDQFEGAVILTYTLNLNFFEQLIAPQLYATGCTNILILADTFGYDEAITHSAQTVTSAGTRYVCSYLLNQGRGVQHAKCVLLAGSRQGRLLIGSGNLTLPGYGRNLELFHRFDVRLAPDSSPQASEIEPFTEIWRLLNQLRENDLLTSAASDRLSIIEENSRWLRQAVHSQDGCEFWHTWSDSLMARLRQLPPVEELHVIAPFVDPDTVATLLHQFTPERLILGIDASHPSVDGSQLALRCRDLGCDLELRLLRGYDSRRTLHAKAIIGVHAEGSWCMSGSANCTAPALLKHWKNGGNLELSVWQSSSDPAAYDHLWYDDTIVYTVQDPALVQVNTPVAPPGTDELNAAPVRLLDLNCRQDIISGKMHRKDSTSEPIFWFLELLHQRVTLPLQVDNNGKFSIQLERPLKTTEAARVIGYTGNDPYFYSPYQWIDLLDELARFGRRSFSTRMTASLQSFDGSGQLFEELLNYLWSRVDPSAIQRSAEEDERIVRRFRGRRPSDEEADDDPSPPLANFVTEENLTSIINWRAGFYSPYDRSTLSLRDLLSLVLLRVTSETVLDEPVTADDKDNNEERDAQILAERQQRRQDAQKQLRNYLLHYCDRYAKRVLEHDFLSRIDPSLLFENHYTLGRVLLEFADKRNDPPVFTTAHLRECTLPLLASIFWPRAGDLSGKGAWDELVRVGRSVDELRHSWDAAQMSLLSVLLVAEGWGRAPAWQEAMGDSKKVRRYLRMRELIKCMESSLGKRFWETISESSVDAEDLWGFRTLQSVRHGNQGAYVADTAVQVFEKLTRYQSPVVEKYRTLFSWWRLRHQGKLSLQQATEWQHRIAKKGHQHEFGLLSRLPTHGKVLHLKEGRSECPGCYIQLPATVIHSVRRGNLELCPNCRRTVMYWEPRL